TKKDDGTEHDALRALLRALVSGESVTTLEQAYTRIAAWFEEAMNRVGGAYKRQAHLKLALVAVVATVVLNVDALLV
ncbi:hypothetical protein Q8G50_34955, partial [Klebsiella pneumoniae]